MPELHRALSASTQLGDDLAVGLEPDEEGRMLVQHPDRAIGGHFEVPDQRQRFTGSHEVERIGGKDMGIPRTRLRAGRGVGRAGGRPEEKKGEGEEATGGRGARSGGGASGSVRHSGGSPV
ncbi:MAG: hypothetical protein EA351_01695 [Gemmatimonadales bacterium]|nr:MAG: hypothetical protein EA351_01695 [Gemmatimonadales bacterium]